MTSTTKNTNKPETVKKRIRRTEDQMVADLQTEIERLKRRAQAKKAKQSCHRRSHNYEKLTSGTARSPSSSISKNSACPQLKLPAIMLDGNDSIRTFKLRTVPL